MDENKMKAALKGIYDNLTDEQKAKAKACKSEQELLDFAGEEGIELPDDLAESVSGGFNWADGVTYGIQYATTEIRKKC